MNARVYKRLVPDFFWVLRDGIKLSIIIQAGELTKLRANVLGGFFNCRRDALLDPETLNAVIVLPCSFVLPIKPNDVDLASRYHQHRVCSKQQGACDVGSKPASHSP